MKGLVVSWMSLVASATAAASGISSPAMTSGMTSGFPKVGRLWTVRPTPIQPADRPAVPPSSGQEPLISGQG